MANQEIMRKWVDALRSGDYKQGKDVLRNGRGEYCCLGVLCDLYDEGTWTGPTYRTEGPDGETSGSSTLLTYHVREWADLDSASPLVNRYGKGNPEEGRVFLTELNDNGATFDEIADLIENEFLDDPRGGLAE